jgi:hypothetical protein
MLKNYRIVVFLAFLLLLTPSVFSQNRFEGYNLLLDVPDNQKTQTCALRYVAAEGGATITRRADARYPERHDGKLTRQRR